MFVCLSLENIFKVFGVQYNYCKLYFQGESSSYSVIICTSLSFLTGFSEISNWTFDTSGVDFRSPSPLPGDATAIYSYSKSISLVSGF